MQMGGPGISLVTVIPSGDGVLRGNDKIPENEDVFTGFTSMAPAAAEYSYIQLKNPIGSGKIVLIDMVVIPVAGTRMQLGRYDTDLTTDNGAWDNATSGGAAGVAHKRVQTLGSIVGTVMFYVENASDATSIIPLPIPIMLLEGEGFIAVNIDINSLLRCTFYGREV